MPKNKTKKKPNQNKTKTKKKKRRGKVSKVVYFLCTYKSTTYINILFQEQFLFNPPPHPLFTPQKPHFVKNFWIHPRHDHIFIKLQFSHPPRLLLSTKKLSKFSECVSNLTALHLCSNHYHYKLRFFVGWLTSL